MKIGIYDKWLRSLGGGEKVSTVMAEVLSKAKKNNVDLISLYEMDKDFIESKLNCDLSRVNFVCWYERNFEKLSQKTKAYDLFVNVSFLDHLPTLAKKSIYYTHFPTPVERNMFGFLKYETLLPFLRKFLIIPEVIRGSDMFGEVGHNIYMWLAPRNEIMYSNSPEKFLITFRIYTKKFNFSLMNSIEFGSPNCEISLVNRSFDHKHNVFSFILKVMSKKSQNAILEIILNDFIQKNSFLLVSFTVHNFRYFLFNLLKHYFPKLEAALYGSSTFEPPAELDTYNLFLANSQFTKSWVKKYWDKDSKVLYPPVDVENFNFGKKKDIILNVGRFFIGGHSKRQDVLVKVFKEMFDQKMLGSSWQLHLVGSVAQGEEHENYVSSLQEESKGYPIFFHFSLNFEKLEKLYSESKIYWHATGFGENVNKNPISFEHFGITIVEAMAAGCVPIVFAGGGVSETVGEKAGFVWNSVDQLKSITKQISEDKRLLERMSKNARAKAMSFSRKRFAKEFLSYVNSFMNKSKL